MSDIFHEIEEDIRRERLGRLWKRFGPAIIALAVLIVVGVAGWRTWEWYSARQAAQSGERYESILSMAREGKHAEAEAALQTFSSEAPSGYAELARFREASEASARDKTAGIQAFDTFAADAGNSQPLRDLARIRAALIAVDSTAYDDMKARLDTLAAPGNSWRHAAREILALSAWKAGNVAETQRWAEELVSDAEVQGGSRARGQLLLDLVAGHAGGPAQPAAKQ